MTPKRKKRTGKVAPLVRALLFLVYGVPILWIVLTSLKTANQVFNTGWGMIIFSPNLTAYTKNFTGALVQAGLQSVIISTGTSALVLLVAIPAAYGLARTTGRIPTIALGLLIVLQMVPQTATVIPLFQIFGGWGLLDQTMGVIIADSALLTPFAILLLRPFFRGVPPALEESGAIDGASVWRIFRSIVLPIARNGVATTATLVFLISWGEFLYSVNFFLSPGKYPLSAVLAQQVTAFGIDWPSLMALAVMTSIPILILFIATYRQLRDGLTMGAVK
jgi:multiple sugar transport system permease protein